MNGLKYTEEYQKQIGVEVYRPDDYLLVRDTKDGSFIRFKVTGNIESSVDSAIDKFIFESMKESRKEKLEKLNEI